MSGLSPLACRTVTSARDGTLTLARGAGRQKPCRVLSLKTPNPPSPQEAAPSSCGSFSWNCCPTSRASHSSAGRGTDGSSSWLTPTRYGQRLGAQAQLAGHGKASPARLAVGGLQGGPGWLRRRVYGVRCHVHRLALPANKKAQAVNRDSSR